MNFKSVLTAEENQFRDEIIQKLTQHPDRPLPYKPEYARLLTKNVLVVEDGIITAVYPISVKPTNKKVSIQGLTQPIYAMCAIDAIGIVFTLNTSITIESEDEQTGEPVQLEVSPHDIINRSNSEVYVLYKEVCHLENCHTNYCPFIHFFVSKENIKEYIKKHPSTYQILNLHEAHQVARQLFF